ncbi:MAG: glycosyltransferase family 4 protein [Pyrinomonadaceae bacterium]
MNTSSTNKPLIFLGPLPPPYGGVSVFLSTLFSHVRDSNVRLWTYTGNVTPDEHIERFNHRRLGVNSLLLKHGSNARIVDFSHFHLEYPNPILLPVWLAAKGLLGFYWYKCICDGSLPDRYSSFSPLQKLLFDSALRRVDEFIVVGDELKQWLTNKNNVRQKVTVIRSLLRSRDDQMSVQASLDVESRLNGFLQHEKRVCSIGTFISDYGFDQVANAVEKLRAHTGDNIGLLLIDGAFATDETYKRQVVANRSWVTVVAGVPNRQVYEMLRHCDLFVRAFRSESYGISRVEAIWCGVPVIATDVGETRGMLTYRFGDDEKLTELIRSVLMKEVYLELETAAAMFYEEADQNVRIFADAVNLSLNSSTLAR